VTPKQAESALRGVLGPLLRAYGFEPAAPFAYLRRHFERVERIGFSVFKDRVGRLRFSLGVGILFPKLEEMRGRVDKGDDTPTVGVPMHFLREPRRYFDWAINEPIDRDALAGLVRTELESFVLPFLARYDTLDALRASLEREDASHWFTLDLDQRDEMLAVLDALQRGKPAAVQRLRAALEKRATAAPKSRRGLELLRDRFQSVESKTDG
jgi:hypothetical protein